MARPDPRQLLAQIVAELEERRDGYLADLSNRMDKNPRRLTTNEAYAVNARYREAGDILEFVQAGIRRLA